MSTETQDTVYRWIRDTFGECPPGSPRRAYRMAEEVLELLLALGESPADIALTLSVALGKECAKVGQGWHESRPNPAKVAEEIADVDITLDGVAGDVDISRSYAKDCKMGVNRGRTWDRKGDGTGYHRE